MTDASKDTEKNILNVVEDFDYSTQKDSYNAEFKSWRSSKDNRYGFRYIENKREKVFNDSRGFEKSSQAAAESKSIGRIMYVLGIALLLFLVLDTSAARLFALIFGLFGTDVRASMLSAALYGNVTNVVLVLILSSSLKILVPVIYVLLKLRVPLRVGYMSYLNSSVEILNSIGLALIACTVVCLPNAYSSDAKEIYSFFKSTNTDVSMWGQEEFVAYSMFSLIFVPVAYELFLHGPVFAALRQFGDGFAVAVTTFSSCLIADRAAEIPAMLLISFIAAVSMLRSGSIMSAFLVNIIYKIYSFALIMFENESSANMLLKRNIFMMSALVIGVILSGAVYIARKVKKKQVHFMAQYSSEAKASSRLATAAKSFPFTAVTLLCILKLIIGLVL